MSLLEFALICTKFKMSEIHKNFQTELVRFFINLGNCEITYERVLPLRWVFEADNKTAVVITVTVTLCFYLYDCFGCMCVCAHVHAWFLWGPEEGIGSLRVGVRQASM